MWRDKGDTGGKHGAMGGPQIGWPRTCLARGGEVKCMCEINSLSVPPSPLSPVQVKKVRISADKTWCDKHPQVKGRVTLEYWNKEIVETNLCVTNLSSIPTLVHSWVQKNRN